MMEFERNVERGKSHALCVSVVRESNILRITHGHGNVKWILV